MAVREVWKDIPGYKGKYQASNKGRVRNSKGRILKPDVNERGYYRYGLVRPNGKISRTMAARIILITFKGYPPCCNYHADHKNGDKVDNSVTNLRWLSPHRNANARDRRINGGIYGYKPKGQNKYKVFVTQNGKKHYVGYFATKRQAAAAHKKKCKELGVK